MSGGTQSSGSRAGTRGLLVATQIGITSRGASDHLESDARDQGERPHGWQHWASSVTDTNSRMTHWTHTVREQVSVVRARET